MLSPILILQLIKVVPLIHVILSQAVEALKLFLIILLTS